MQRGTPPDVIFSLLKIHTQHSKKPSPLPAGAFCFLFSLFRTSAKEAAALVPRGEQRLALHGLRNRVRCTWLRHESSAICCRYQPRPTPWGASDGSTAADCLRGRHCCARRRWDCCFSISIVFFSVNGPQLMEIRAGQLRDLA